MQLDSQQIEAVRTIKGPVCITAGPGSGKTRVLTERVFYLINDIGIDPRSILAITFTNKAAEEMRTRINKEVIRLPEIRTFHAFAYNALQNHGNLVGLSNNFAVIEDEKKKKENEVTFDELLELALELFVKHPDVLKKYQDKFEYVLIDEYQDTNKIQAEIIDLIVAKHKNICIVGDPNQAIYGFRGAAPEYFHTFKDRYPNAKLIELRTNYRSTRNIISASDALMNVLSNAHRDFHGLKINITQAETSKQEMINIARKVNELIGGTDMIDSTDRNYSPGDIGVIYRLNAIGQDLEKVFAQANIPYIRSGEEFDDVRIERHAVSLLTAHAAKGLEFPVVFVIGVEEGIFPYTQGKHTDLNEEQRILYVALTRAKEELNISHANKRTLFGKTTDQKQSRFLNTLPNNLTTTKQLITKLNKKRAQRTLF
ncbi:MAG: ATP-dependent helicase [Parcubacteria group bacterium]